MWIYKFISKLKRRNTFATCAVLMVLASTSKSAAYEQPIHMSITEEAFSRSSLSDPDVLWNLGLFSKQEGNFLDTPGEWDSYGVKMCFGEANVLQLLRLGAYMEDAGLRVVNHFYDPHNDEPLHISLTALDLDTYVGRKNLEWALGLPWTSGLPSFLPWAGVTSPQSMSLAKAKDYLYEALTSPSADQRREYYGKLFAALGQVVHLLQDMAQPEHTRNDAHCKEKVCLAPDLMSWEPIYDPSVYERVTNDDGYERYNQTDYPVVNLGTYRDYFTNAEGSGMSDFSNRSFVTKDTNFIGTFEHLMANPRYPQPSPDTAEIVESQVTYTGHDTTLTVFRKEIWAEYVDYYQNEGPQRDHLTATASIFELDIPDVDPSDTVGLTLGISEDSYRSAAQLLLPRAEGYTAGFLDHFFRGRMGARISERGYYAAADHNDGEGFRQVRVQLRNETPDINPLNGGSIPQEMRAGDIVAVASFRENGCYQQDLKGDLHVDEDGYGYFPGECDFNAWQGGEETRVLSAPISVSHLSSEWTEFLFDFSAQPIPFSALDLEMYFIFRGELGQGYDEIVVTRHNISEPTYIGFTNDTDWWWFDTEWIDGFSLLDNDASWDDDRVAQFIDTEYWLNGFMLAYGPLPPGQYQRVAVLVEPGVNFFLELGFTFEFWWDGFSGVYNWSLNPTINATRERKVVVGEFFGFPIVFFYKDWCGDDGFCTLSGLTETRGISHWGNIDLWFYDGTFPSDEELELRANMDVANASGTIVID